MFSEQVETLITGDWRHGSIIPRRPETGGQTFRDLDHAREVYEAHRDLVLRIHRNGWQPGDIEPTLELRCSDWLRHGTPCWAEQVFDHGADPEPQHDLLAGFEIESEPAAPASKPRQRKQPAPAPAEPTERRAFATRRTSLRNSTAVTVART